MLLIGLLFIFLAIRKGFEPLLLIPIDFGMLIGNIPYDASRFSIGVHDGIHRKRCAFAARHAVLRKSTAGVPGRRPACPHRSTAFIDIITILPGLSVGAKTQAMTFLTPQTIYIFVLGVVAFSVSTAAGVLFGKLMSRFSKDPLNPLIGAAGVSAVPMAARVVQKVANEEDPQNFLLMHAMAPNVAGVIGSAVAAGIILSYFAS